MLHKDYGRKGSVEKISLVVSLKGLDAKTNWLAVETVNCIVTLSLTLQSVEAVQSRSWMSTWVNWEELLEELGESPETPVVWFRRDGKKENRLWKEDFMCAAVTLGLV
jgi:hypothetical protein